MLELIEAFELQDCLFGKNYLIACQLSHLTVLPSSNHCLDGPIGQASTLQVRNSIRDINDEDSQESVNGWQAITA